MKINSRKPLKPAAPGPVKSPTPIPVNGSWPFPSKPTPVDIDITTPDEEVLRRTTKDVDISY